LRSIRYGEADSVLTLLTRERGRVSAIAKGTRKAGSRLGGRLQPGVRVHLGLAEGRGELHQVRQAHVTDAHAGLWVEGYRLRAAGCVLESAMRVLIEHEPNEGAFNLVCRSLSELAGAPPRTRPPRLDPIVLGTQCKLLVLAGLFPRIGGRGGGGGGGRGGGGGGPAGRLRPPRRRRALPGLRPGRRAARPRDAGRARRAGGTAAGRGCHRLPAGGRGGRRAGGRPGAPGAPR